MSLLNPEPQKLWRLPVNPGEDEERTIPDDRIAKVRQALRRVDDTTLVKAAMTTRFAMRLKKISQQTGTDRVVLGDSAGQQVSDRLQTQTNEATAAAIQAGIYEITRIYAADNIIDKSANRFNGMGASYSYSTGGAAVEKNVQYVRSRGGATLNEQQWDHVSFACGSTVLYLSTVGDRICYDIVWLDDFHWVHAGEIGLKGGGGIRPVNDLNLDEASVVVIRLAGNDGTKGRYAAWFGASERYPRGRHVRYSASTWDDIPNPADGAYDYVWTKAGGRFEQLPMTEELGNPLTVYQQEHKTPGPEYPFVVLASRPLDVNTLCPVTGLSLWDLSWEYDVGASVALYAANKGALGKEILKPTGDMGSVSVPESMGKRVTVLDRGWDLTMTGWGPEHARKAMEVIKDLLKLTSESFHVPSFMVAPDWSTYPSGIALRMARTDMDAYRDVTVEVARPSVSRRFDIEKALINFSEGTASIPYDVEETWDAGELRWPEEPLVEVEVAAKRLELGVDDMGETVRQLHNLPSYEAALQLIKDMKKRAGKLADEGAKLELSITDAARYITVNEARISRGLTKLLLPDGTDDPDGELPLAIFEAKKLQATEPAAKPKLADRVKAVRPTPGEPPALPAPAEPPPAPDEGEPAP